jgi:diaminopimelate epimerase
MINFRKFEATGNEFLILSLHPCDLSPEQRRWLCDRRRGIGADGLLHIKQVGPSSEYRGEEAVYAFEMHYWNADGDVGTFCGNGARVAVWLAYEASQAKRFFFRAADGAHEGWILNQTPPRVAVSLKLHQAPVPGPNGGFYVHTGSPHLLIPIQNSETLLALPLEDVAKPLRWERTYDSQGVNVSFYAPLEEGYAMRTYERGVEAETLSCGTAAVALAALLDQAIITLYPPGGNLTVTRLNELTFRLEGPISEVIRGEIPAGSPLLLGCDKPLSLHKKA